MNKSKIERAYKYIQKNNKVEDKYKKIFEVDGYQVITDTYFAFFTKEGDIPLFDHNDDEEVRLKIEKALTLPIHKFDSIKMKFSEFSEKLKKEKEKLFYFSDVNCYYDRKKIEIATSLLNLKSDDTMVISFKREHNLRLIKISKYDNETAYSIVCPARQYVE